MPFGVYSLTADDPSVTPILKKYYTATNDALFPDFNLQTFEFTTFPNQERTIMSDSLPKIASFIPFAQQNNVKYITYDFESWDFTPLSEQNDPVGAFNNASKIIHAAGLKFAYNPTMSYFKTYYQQLDWTKCDMLNLPFDGLVQWPSKYASLTINVVNYIKSKNPNIVIYDSVNPKFATPDQMTFAAQSVRNYINGTLVRYVPACTYCTPTNLDQVLQSLTGPPPATSVPSTVQSLLAKTGSSKVTLSWHAPLSNGGSPVISYIVQYKKSTDSAWTTLDSTVTPYTITSYTITGLASGQTYNFKVASVNTVGTGTFANVDAKPT
jgi:hypothetical protein